MRMYFEVGELKKMGLPWKQLVHEDPLQKRKNIVLELLANNDFETQEERATEFVRRGLVVGLRFSTI